MSEGKTIPLGTLFRGRYEVQSLLGRGGFSTTYLTLDHETFNRRCVLKEILPDHETDVKVQELFEREARMLGELRHRCIPRLDAFFVDGGHFYLVEEFVPGQTLAALVKEKGALLEREVREIAGVVLEIVRYLHERRPRVIHRDIKPSNLMVTDAGNYLLIDFGSVREAVLSSSSTGLQSTVVASSGYTPPEQLLGRTYPASDLYALGATLLHLLTGKHPLHWYNSRQGRWIYEGKLPLSAGFASVLGRMLAESLSDRYESAQEALEDLRRVPASFIDINPTVLEAAPSERVSQDLVGEPKSQFQCFFCGRRIEPDRSGICALTVVINWDGRPEEQRQQGFFCHADCFRSTAHESVPLYLFRSVKE